MLVLLACSAPDGRAASPGATTVEVTTAPSAVASGSPELTQQQQKMLDELSGLDIQTLGALSTTGEPGTGVSFPVLNEAAAQAGGSIKGLDAGPGTGSSSASISGKAPKDAKEADVDKAIRDAGCKPKLLPNKTPLSIFEVSCGDRAYEVTLAPRGAKLAAGQRDTLTKDAAMFEEDGMLLVVRASTGTDLDRAGVLLRKLRGDPKAGLPTGNVSVGGASVSDGNVSNAGAVVAGMAAGFRRCINRALEKNPQATGSLKLSLRIGPNGEVLGATASDVSPDLGSVVTCVEGRATASSFAPPEGGKATISFPLTFSSTLITP